MWSLRALGDGAEHTTNATSVHSASSEDSLQLGKKSNYFTTAQMACLPTTSIPKIEDFLLLGIGASPTATACGWAGT